MDTALRRKALAPSHFTARPKLEVTPASLSHPEGQRDKNPACALEEVEFHL